MVSGKKDVVSLKEESTNGYEVSKSQNDETRDLIAKMKNKDRLDYYSNIVKLISIGVSAINSMVEMWTSSYSIKDCSTKLFSEVFDGLVDIDNRFLDLGVAIREERKDFLKKTQLVKVTSKVEKEPEKPMFG